MAAQQAAAVQGRERIGVHYGAPIRSYNHQAQTPNSALNNNTIFSAASSDSYDSDVEVLPLAPTALGETTPSTKRPSGSRTPSGSGAGATAGLVPEDGKWFQALDERYLLPLFSNATASRTFHARKARRSSAMTPGGAASGSRLATPGESDEEGEDGTELDLTAAGRSPRYSGSPPRIPQDPNAREIPRAVPDESRIERGLASPMLRRDSEGQSRNGSDRS